jgi:dipeptidyl aminopeptidase/acylaminoacyl peptidase
MRPIRALPWLTLLLLAALLAACASANAPAGDPAPTATSFQPLPTDPPALATLVPTATFSPTETPAPTPTATPTPHPMTIVAMRAGSYPGSDIVIERELEPGSNYRRYYASYRSEGLKIYALLTVPNGEIPPGGFPGIVFNHGYIPPDVYRTTERYINYVDRLATAGYVIFRIDYRGHDQSEGQPTGAYGSPGYAVDVLNAVSSLQRFPQVNPEKIGLWGHSMGGYLTLRSMVITDQVKAGVIWAGVVGSYPDLLYNWRRSSSAPRPTPPAGARRWRDEWLAEFGSPEQNPEFWASISANSFLADLSGPVQLHHGTADEDVPVEFSVRLAEQIQSAGGAVELYTYDGDNHNLSGYFTTAMNRTIEFFDRYLKTP